MQVILFVSYARFISFFLQFNRICLFGICQHNVNINTVRCTCWNYQTEFRQFLLIGCYIHNKISLNIRNLRRISRCVLFTFFYFMYSSVDLHVLRNLVIDDRCMNDNKCSIQYNHALFGILFMYMMCVYFHYLQVNKLIDLTTIWHSLCIFKCFERMLKQQHSNSNSNSNWSSETAAAAWHWCNQYTIILTIHISTYIYVYTHVYVWHHIHVWFLMCLCTCMCVNILFYLGMESNC